MIAQVEKQGAKNKQQLNFKNLAAATEMKNKAFQKLHSAIGVQTKAMAVKKLTSKTHLESELAYKAAHKKSLAVSKTPGLQGLNAAQARLDASNKDEQGAKKAEHARIIINKAHIAAQKLSTASKAKASAAKYKERTDKVVAKAEKHAEEVTVAMAKSKILKTGSPMAKKLFKKSVEHEKEKIKAAMRAAGREGLDPTNMRQAE